MSIKYVIRSYQRPDMIKTHTMNMLQVQKDIDFSEQVYLVLASKEEYELYKSKGVFDVDFKDVIIAERGGHNAIKYAHQYFPEGEKIIFLDDDLKNLKIRRNLKDIKQIEDCFNLNEVFAFAFDQMEKTKLGTALAVNFANIMFKRDFPFLEFKARQLGGTFWGCFNSKHILTEQSHEDDNIRTANFLAKDGGVYCIHGLDLSTKIFLNAGGMQSSGDRGKDGETRLEITKQMALKALEHENMKKFYRDEIHLKEDSSVYSTKLKKKKDLLQFIPNYVEYAWHEYLNHEYEIKGNKQENSLENFFE